ncbi:MAG: acyltransferase [Myxococcales bacterium]|nr:MAG: acyltransferase [Myxococcales bacterium]
MVIKDRVQSLMRRMLKYFLVDIVNEIRLSSYLVFGPAERLRIHHSAEVQNALFNVRSGDITVEEFAFFGHNVTLLTGRHDITKFDQARQQGIPSSGNNIIVRRGAWIASNALVIGPCEIGEHSVVAAGAIVTRDVPPYSIVAGNPAKVLRQIPGK